METMVLTKGASRKGLEPTETASLDELRTVQLDRLKWTIQHTYNNGPPFRHKCEESGITPGDVGVIEDFAKFPFMTKEDLRGHYPFGLFAVPRERVARIHASSGTTGKPTVVGYTSRDINT